MCTDNVIDVPLALRRAICVAVLSGACWPVGNPPAQAQQARPPLLASMKEAKTLAEDYAAIVRTKFSKSSSEYVKAEQLYAVARSKYAGVIQAMKLAIEEGDLKKLEENKSLTQSATEAKDAATRYFEHVEKILSKPQSKGAVAAIAVLSSIVAVITEVIGSIDKGAKTLNELQKERAEMAEKVQTELAWKAWYDIPGK